jgi:hypothetical protein
MIPYARECHQNNILLFQHFLENLATAIITVRISFHVVFTGLSVDVPVLRGNGDGLAGLALLHHHGSLLSAGGSPGFFILLEIREIMRFNYSLVPTV